MLAIVTGALVPLFMGLVFGCVRADDQRWMIVATTGSGQAAWISAFLTVAAKRWAEGFSLAPRAG